MVPKFIMQKSALIGLGLIFVLCAIIGLQPVFGSQANIPFPVNIATTTQTKSGNLAVNIVAATEEVRSDRYCNSVGQNCIQKSGTSTGILTQAGTSSKAAYNTGTNFTDLSATFTVPYKEVPTLLLTPTTRASGTKYVSGNFVNTYDADTCEMTVTVTKTGFYAQYSPVFWSWTGTCAGPLWVDWIAIGN